MKLLLALLLFASVAVGQKKDSVAFRFIDSVRVRPDSEVDQSVGVFLRLYSFYERECFKDTIHLATWTWKKLNRDGSQWIFWKLVDYQADTVLIVRRPMLERFAEFLRRQR